MKNPKKDLISKENLRRKWRIERVEVGSQRRTNT